MNELGLKPVTAKQCKARIVIQFASLEDCEIAYKVLAKQCGNAEQTMSGLYASLLKSAVQRAKTVVMK